MHPRTATARPGRVLPALIIAPALLLGGGSGLTEVAAQSGEHALRDAAPADAYMYLYSAHEGRSPLVDEYVHELLQAVGDAHFDQLVLDVLGTVLKPDELQAARGVHAEVTRMLCELPWDALAETDFLMARGFVSDSSARSFQDSIMFGLSFPEGGSVAMQQGLRDMAVTLMQMFGGDVDEHPEVALRVTVGRGAGARVLPDLAASRDVAALVAPGQPVTYTLMVRSDAWEIREGHGESVRTSTMAETGLKFAFVDDVMLLNLSPQVHDNYLDKALSFLTDGGGTRLTDMPRFQRARAALPDGYELFYMDFPNMFRPMMDFAERMIDSEASAQEAIYARAILAEVDELLSPLGAMAFMSRAADETHIVNDGVFMYEDTPTTRTNPFYLMARGPFRGDPDLLSAVPADATAFHAYTGLDLGPLHDWALEQVEQFVPESEKVLAAYDAAQGVLGLDIRDDLLMLFGSGMTTATFPARRPTATHSEDMVMVGRPADPAAAKAMNKRLMRIVRAGGAFQDDANMLFKQLERELPVLQMAGLNIELADAPEAFPGMTRLSLTAFGQHHLYFGMVGDQWMASSSPEALHYVLETMGGEHDDIRANPEFAALARLPDDGPLWSVRMTDYSNLARDLQQAMVGIQSFAPMMVMGMTQGDKQAAQALQTGLDVLPRLSGIFAHLDFLGRSVYWSQVSEDGMQERFYTVQEYKRPEQRPSFQRR